VERPGFGDLVRIGDSSETRELGYSGRQGQVFGESIPSSSGVEPVIGDRGEDFALSVFFEDTREQEWFAPHLVEFVGRPERMEMSIDGGPSYELAPDGSWTEVRASTTRRLRGWLGGRKPGAG
jgi:hypothetical protein